jgi:glutamate 5-kinase
MNFDSTDIQTLVVKIGTSLLTGPNGFDGRVLDHTVQSLAALKRDQKLNIVIVSSGAMGCGMDALKMTQRPTLLPMKQAAAAVGQSRLMHYYETLFQHYGDGLKTAQVLLSAGDLEDRKRYLNIRNTMQTLFEIGFVVPVVNENDTVAPDELRIGDNDTLAARVAAKIDADLLIILSDVDGLYDKNPARFQDAKLIEQVAAVSDDVESLAEDTITETTIGGMKTKLAAARIACSAGVRTVIANGRRENIVRDVLEGTAQCTSFGVSTEALSHRKRWIAYGRNTRGTLQIDPGAVSALLEKGRSLLAAGVTGVIGDFEVGASVRIAADGNREVACGLVNYSSKDINRIKGCKSDQIHAILGRKDYDEIIHRDNMVILR